MPHTQLEVNAPLPPHTSNSDECPTPWKDNLSSDRIWSELKMVFVFTLVDKLDICIWFWHQSKVIQFVRKICFKIENEIEAQGQSSPKFIMIWKFNSD